MLVSSVDKMSPQVRALNLRARDISQKGAMKCVWTTIFSIYLRDCQDARRYQGSILSALKSMQTDPANGQENCAEAIWRSDFNCNGRR